VVSSGGALYPPLAPRARSERYHARRPVWFNERVSWPVAPFIGTIAVAPEREVLTSIFGQGIGGGNIDCRDIRPGDILYLNAQNDGGLLFVGDVHASQGDTEFSGVAAESRAEVTLSVEIIPGKRFPIRGLKPHQPDRPLQFPTAGTRRHPGDLPAHGMVGGGVRLQPAGRLFAGIGKSGGQGPCLPDDPGNGAALHGRVEFPKECL